MPLFYQADRLSVQKSAKPILSNKMNKNNMLDRRFSVAPLMDWTGLLKKQSSISN
jgi:hypothetical protein